MFVLATMPSERKLSQITNYNQKEAQDDGYLCRAPPSTVKTRRSITQTSRAAEATFELLGRLSRRFQNRLE